MVSAMEKVVSIGAVLIFLQSTVLGDLQCYQCRGTECEVPSPEHLVTCELDQFLSTTTPSPEFVTDSDTNFDQESEQVQVAEWPLLELVDSLESTNRDQGLVIDASELPGADRFSFRRLAQATSEDSLRCVVATYRTEEDTVSTVRTCALLAVNNYETCLGHVGGELLSCHVCDTDMCNAAAAPASAAALTAALAAIWIYGHY